MNAAALPQTAVTLDAGTALGPLEGWRHSLGLGGINPVPLPPRVVAGIRALRPRLIRIFLQEFFHIYPDHGRFDWSRLDPYMDSLAATGAQVMAAITLKPAVLYPQVDQRIWQPNNVEEWQQVIAALVRRYSVERPLVTHWEIGNETDIGESGGTPQLIPDPDDYTAFYQMTVPPILETFPAARVGGPAACWIENEPLPGFVARCREQGLPLHFVTWHLYHSDPVRHAAGVAKAQQLVEGFPDPKPELMVTEWNQSFEPVSVEEAAFTPGRAARVASILIAMLDAGLDSSFYYHLWDQVCEPADFAPFFSPKGVDGMLRHWNEVPHRFGLFGVDDQARPQYFVYQMLGQLGEERVAAHVEEPALHVLAARGDAHVAAMLVNGGHEASTDRVLSLQFTGLRPGRRRFTVHRIDAERRWSGDPPALHPVERREVATRDQFACQLLAPAGSVTLATLAEVR